jgi:HPt (histidine-containing phosphotransfer) domain-containing protein
MRITLEQSALTDPRLFSREERVEMVGQVVEAAEQALTRASEQLEAGTLQDLGRTAHVARNNALSIGARQLADACWELEQAARAGDRDAATSCLAQAEELWPPTRAAIDQLTDQL